MASYDRNQRKGTFLEAMNMMRPLLAFFCLWLSVATLHDQALSELSSSETVQLLEAENANTISFDEKVAFMSPTGEEITPSIGTYRV